MSIFFQKISIIVPFRTQGFNPMLQKDLLAKRIIQTIIVGFSKMAEIMILVHLKEWISLQKVKKI